jgi:predicted nucleotide-binding protein
MSTEAEGARKPRAPSRPFPNVTLEQASAIADGLKEHGAKRPMNRVLLAKALHWSPSSSGFRDLIAASAKYGLTKGNFNSDNIELTDLGLRYTTPLNHEERAEVLQLTMRTIPVFAQLLDYYDNNKLPQIDFLKNVLERAPFNVDSAWSEEAARVFVDTARFTGLVTDVGGSLYVIKNAAVEGAAINSVTATSSPATSQQTNAGSAPAEVAEPPSAAIAPAEPLPTPAVKRHFFIAHGKDQKALEQLKTILRELNIPFVVAVDEPNMGRPISQKIADLMQSCYAGIFLFSADEDVMEGETLHKRPRMNVVFELGAASLLYGQRIVILKEKHVDFPTDFRDLGYIEYEKDHLAEKSMELLRELIKLKAVALIPSS